MARKTCDMQNLLQYAYKNTRAKTRVYGKIHSKNIPFSKTAKNEKAQHFSSKKHKKLHEGNVYITQLATKRNKTYLKHRQKHNQKLRCESTKSK